MQFIKIAFAIALLVLTIPALATVHSVGVANFSFSPANLTIQFGDTIVWHNNGGTHNVHETGTPAAFFSGAPSSAAWTYQYPNASETEPLPVGTYHYVCDAHAPGMAGNITVEGTGIGDLPGSMPGELSLAQNYPNPFNSSSSIVFSLPVSTPVRLTVYNVLGEEIKTLVSDFLPAGQHSISFGGDDLSTGFYFYTLQTPAATLTRKMQYVK